MGSSVYLFLLIFTIKVYTPLLSYRGDREEQFVQRKALKENGEDQPKLKDKTEKADDEKAARVWIISI